MKIKSYYKRFIENCFEFKPEEDTYFYNRMPFKYEGDV
jgi:hypothetical protein